MWGLFEQTSPSVERYWRAIILFGRNAVSYKLALGRSLSGLLSGGKSMITLEELARPSASSIAQHLAKAPKQTTASSTT